ncbi:Cd(II)/Pb(II)-responsive transcriptional regulator [Chitinasiproducens palmae]|uniref:Cd(II)/Pb(II)-responsive transcriptional regulator n=1 Tax=Chitinasiproducens palmae TaxID=1770053 RepID=A0A1H2PQC4_9BURK|nr:Cd(II)/Pb(II)-responsive transcriptional regulator [Chitinasiproducens palmae]SDV48187.1 Cd(II)/Pb(II)-responsive transcriptional regulator [Chitinasiproducens palmae]
MKIGELAKRTGCTVETIRYYEREGLLDAPSRSSGNYRLYAAPHVKRLTFIRNCRALDMTHGEIRALLAVWDSRDATGGPEDCSAANALLDEHIAHVETRIAELQTLQTQLLALREHCDWPRQPAECGILRELAADPVDDCAPVAGAVHPLGGTHSHRR